MTKLDNMITVLQPEPGSKGHVFPAATSWYLGIVHVAIGIFSFIFHIVALVKDAGASEAGHGMWGGAAFIILGSIAAYAALRPHSYVLAALLGVSILCVLVSIMMFICSAMGLSADSGWVDCPMGFACREATDDYNWRVRLAMNSLLLIFSLAEILLSFWTFTICGQIEIILATTQMELPESHQNVAYNQYAEPPPAERGHHNPPPPERSVASHDAGKHLAVAHGYNETPPGSRAAHGYNPTPPQSRAAHGYQQPPPGARTSTLPVLENEFEPDYSSMNRRAPLPSNRHPANQPSSMPANQSSTMPANQTSTMPRNGYGYETRGNEFQNSAFAKYPDENIGTL